VNRLWWSIGLTYNGVKYRKSITFGPQDLSQTVPPVPTANNPKITRTLYYGIWTYTVLANLINSAIIQLQVEIKNDQPAYTKPYLRFEFLQDGSNTFQVIADYLAFGDEDNELYLDEHLLQFFQGFTYTYNVPIDFGLDEQGLGRLWNRLEFLDNSTNVSNDIIKLKQDFPVMASIPSMRSIQLRSDQLGLNPEWAPSAGASSDGTPSYQRILAEFTPQYTDTVGASVPRSGISYSINSSWRLISILDAAELRAVSLAVFWIDEEGNAYRIGLNPRESISLKLCFHLRSTYAG
jgi:hypothetical protein